MALVYKFGLKSDFFSEMKPFCILKLIGGISGHFERWFNIIGLEFQLIKITVNLKKSINLSKYAIDIPWFSFIFSLESFVPFWSLGTLVDPLTQVSLNVGS